MAEERPSWWRGDNTVEVLWVSHGCTRGDLCSSWSRAAAAWSVGWVEWPWHWDLLVIPRDTGAPWSCACSGEGEEHSELPLPS